MGHHYDIEIDLRNCIIEVFYNIKVDINLGGKRFLEAAMKN